MARSISPKGHSGAGPEKRKGIKSKAAVSPHRDDRSVNEAFSPSIPLRVSEKPPLPRVRIEVDQGPRADDEEPVFDLHLVEDVLHLAVTGETQVEACALAVDVFSSGRVRGGGP